MGTAIEELEKMARDDIEPMGWYLLLPVDTDLADEPAWPDPDQAFDADKDGVWASLDVRISLV